jgi:hypothetical protein
MFKPSYPSESRDDCSTTRGLQTLATVRYSVKGKVVPVFNSALRHEDVWGVDVYTHVFLTSALVGDEWSASCFGRFTPGTHWKRGWVGPRAGLDDMENLNKTFSVEIK